MLCVQSFDISIAEEQHLIEKALELSARVSILRSKIDIVDLIQYVQAFCQRTHQTDAWSELVLSHFSEAQLMKVTQLNLID